MSSFAGPNPARQMPTASWRGPGDETCAAAAAAARSDSAQLPMLLLGDGITATGADRAGMPHSLGCTSAGAGRATPCGWVMSLMSVAKDARASRRGAWQPGFTAVRLGAACSRAP